MPNWCNGFVNVIGKRENVKNFCKLFLFERENDDEVPEKYFARSFVQESWEDFEKEYLTEEVYGDDDIEFSVDFAWSVWSCLIEGYPQDEPDKCVTLKWASKEFNVYVEIESEEEGMCFEEKVICDKGKLNYSSKDMPKYTCQNCGVERHIPSAYPLDEADCSECGEIGNWTDIMKELIEERLKVKDGR